VGKILSCNSFLIQLGKKKKVVKYLSSFAHKIKVIFVSFIQCFSLCGFSSSKSKGCSINFIIGSASITKVDAIV
jgi:hypothetical protein